MATKAYILNFFLIVINFQAIAQSDQQQLADWTEENEKKLVDTYPSVRSEWFEEECLELAKQMQFKKLNQCHLFKSDNINAYIFDNGHVYFSTAMMTLINNKHQWASILAHENAHIELQHYLKTLRKIKKPGIFFPKRRIQKLLKKHEQEADDWAEQKLTEFHFMPLQITYFLQRVEKQQGKSKSNTHLKLSKRIKKNPQPEVMDSAFKEAFNP